MNRATLTLTGLHREIGQPKVLIDPIDTHQFSYRSAISLRTKFLRSTAITGMKPVDSLAATLSGRVATQKCGFSLEFECIRPRRSERMDSRRSPIESRRDW